MFEKSSLKDQVWSRLKIQFVKLEFSKIKYRWIGRQNSKNIQNYLLILLLLPDSLSTFIILFFRFVDPTDGEFRTIPANAISNNFRIDSAEVTGDCCFEIEANNGDYESVDPENPRVVFDTTFYIHTISVYNSCWNGSSSYFLILWWDQIFSPNPSKFLLKIK